MNKMIMVCLFLVVILSGCMNMNSNVAEISEAEAKQIVLGSHTQDIGEVEIISVTTKSNKYIIEWENKENCENGTDSISMKSGEIKMIEASIC